MNTTVRNEPLFRKSGSLKEEGEMDAEEIKPFFRPSGPSPSLPASYSSAPFSPFSIRPQQQGRKHPPHSAWWKPTRRDAIVLLLGALVGWILLKLIFSSMSFLRSQRQQQQTPEQLVPERHGLNFLVVGDWGRRGLYNQSQVAIQMGRIGWQLGIEFVISTGDNFYDTGLNGTDDPKFAASFTNVFTAPSLQTKWYAVLGNHDYMGNVLSQMSSELVKRDLRWHCRREFEVHHSPCSKNELCKGSVDLFFIDTTPFVDEYWDSNSKHVFDWRGLAPRENQLKSQLQGLAEKLDKSNAIWKIVIGHHTVRSVGHHGDTPELVNQLLPVLEKYRVDVYINGHDHNLQHIKRSNSSVHFFTSGGGSKAFKGLQDYGVEAGVKFVFDGQGFLAVSIVPDFILFRFYDVFGEVMYSYQLHKW
ncbi:hypothetical protein KP509_03G061900 [Ceratopteris richardii]|uniref:acid phosphatase n=1 Tax=Ceratopteris richardii TaxID=49495 RepID=A0A8T2V7F4_CERRI|nr:hypothetical protein KP509_03G061900 [Ceratopteris richardii]